MESETRFRTSIFDEEEAASLITPLLKAFQQANDPSYAPPPPPEHIEDEWSAEDNPYNPRNWSYAFRWTTVALVSFIECLTTMPNFMYAPNITDAQRDLHTDDDTLATLSLSIYVLGFGLGPLLFAPLSEIYGRAVVYRSCLSLFLLCTVGCALSSSIEMLVVFRFLAGSLGAAPVAIGGAVVGDIFLMKERGAAMSIYQAGQIISAVVGPPMGGVVGMYLAWRWVFWIVCILAGIALPLTFVVLKETHARTLQRTFYGRRDSVIPGTDQRPSLVFKLRRALRRPLMLLTKSPVVFLCCCLIFLVIGILNIFLTEMSRFFQAVYHMTPGQTSGLYLGLASGFVLASITFGTTNDRIMHMLARQNQNEPKPEFRLPATVVAMPIIVIGLLWYGWTLHFRTAWYVPIIGSGVAGFGITTVQLSVTTYLVDCFEAFSASALAAITMARSIGGALLPLIGPLLYKQLGQGWGNTVLASLTLFSSAFPILLYIFGDRWRAMLSTDEL